MSVTVSPSIKFLLALIVAFPATNSLVAQTPEPPSAFLRERVSVTTKTGVTGMAPGTRVDILARHGSKVTVSASGQKFDVSADQITTDATLSEQVRQKDAAEQQTLEREAAAREARAQEAAANQQQQIAALAAQQEQGSQHSNSLDGKLEEIRKKRELLKVQLDRVYFEQKDLPPPNSSHPVGRRRRSHGPHTVIETSPNAFKLEKQAKELEQQIFDLNEQEKLIRLQPPPTAAPRPMAAVRPTVSPLLATPTSVNSATPISATVGQGRAMAVSAPRPDYPYEERTRGITGKGVAELTVDASTGTVTQARMAESTGSPVLDDAAVTAFRRWRFKPGNYSPAVRIPITYTATGASY